jgi:Family of unknown function (DUF6365)
VSRTHLFLALANAAWGELLYATRVARQLTSAGDRVLFLAPAGTEVMLRGTGIPLFALHWDWVSQVKRMIATERCASLVLVDVAITYTYLEAAKLAPTFLGEISVPVIGIDVWNLETTDLKMERGAAGWAISEYSRELSRRLIPSPMIRPTGWSNPLAAGVYNSLDEEVPTRTECATVRTQMGLGERDRLILLPMASWQQPEHDPTDPYVARLCRQFPALLAAQLARLRPEVRVLQIGVRAIPELAATLGSRYRVLPQLPRSAFLAALGAADLLLSFNTLATTIAAAALLDVPCLLGRNSYRGQTVDELVGQLPFSPTEATRATLAKLVPLYPFRVWPFGLYQFTAPIVAINPCIEMTHGFEILDEEGFVAAASALLWDSDVIAETSARMASCLDLVRALPSAVAVLAHHLGA